MIITNGKAMKFGARKWKNRSEKRKKNEEQLREKKREKTLILKLAKQVINFVFLQKEVTN